MSQSDAAGWIEALVRRAQAVGTTIDLSGIGYGTRTRNNAVVDGDFEAEPAEYYHFLAGLARTQNASRILEIGTHMGGSARAMLRGMEDPAGILVTVDVNDLAAPYLGADSRVRCVVADAETPEAFEKVADAFGPGSIDLMFVDANHAYEALLRQTALYLMLLRPRLVVFDDINRDASMRAGWSLLRRTFPGRAYDVHGIEPSIRSAACGFGLIVP
jgi:predicted O-methyltransferase YrrM